MNVILVDKNDKKIGEEEKIKAHQNGALHRAFSVLVFNSKKEMILQKRSLSKYHGGGLWTNTCCSHPFPGEKTKCAAHRRLNEEMGFNTSLLKIFSFTYKAEIEDLIEHEFDHVFVGTYDGEIFPNKEEVDDIRFMNIKDIREDIHKNAHLYTPWFKIIMKKETLFLKKLNT